MLMATGENYFSIRLRPLNNYGNSTEFNPIRFRLEDRDGNGQTFFFYWIAASDSFFQQGRILSNDSRVKGKFIQ